MRWNTWWIRCLQANAYTFRISRCQEPAFLARPMRSGSSDEQVAWLRCSTELQASEERFLDGSSWFVNRSDHGRGTSPILAEFRPALMFGMPGVTTHRVDFWASLIMRKLEKRVVLLLQNQDATSTVVSIDEPAIDLVAVAIARASTSQISTPAGNKAVGELA